MIPMPCNTTIRQLKIQVDVLTLAHRSFEYATYALVGTNIHASPEEGDDQGEEVISSSFRPVVSGLICRPKRAHARSDKGKLMQIRDELAWERARVGRGSGLNCCGVRPMATLTPEHYRESDPLLTATVDKATVSDVKTYQPPQIPHHLVYRLCIRLFLSPVVPFLSSLSLDASLMSDGIREPLIDRKSVEIGILFDCHGESRYHRTCTTTQLPAANGKPKAMG